MKIKTYIPSVQTNLLQITYALALFTPEPKNVYTDSFVTAAKCPAIRDELNKVWLIQRVEGCTDVERMCDGLGTSRR